tara:strand:+ start:14715 stop:15200 length:486 start_codon:yes stop_codon:yes gene_type:complete
MKIDFNRLNKLAGLPVSNKGAKSLNESLYINEGDNEEEYEEETNEGASCGVDEDEDLYESDHDEDDEMIEVDEAMLVQELRRAKRSIVESAKRKNNIKRKRSRAKKGLVENAIKKIIAEEVENVMQDLNLTSGWIYGGDKPKRSVQGRLNHGGYLKGPGFK